MPMPEEDGTPTYKVSLDLIKDSEQELEPQGPQAEVPEQIPIEETTLWCKMSATSDCTEVTGVCVVCHEPFCDKHCSEADPESCCVCTDFKTIEAPRDPLIDTEGVEHKGAVIHPIGYSYRTLMRRIVEMDDNQLESHIAHVKKQVIEAQTVLDYRRIDQSASQVELEERGVAKTKKLRIRGIETLANGPKVIGLPSPDKGLEAKRAKATVTVAEQLKKTAALLGIKINTPDDLAKFAQKVQAMGMGKKP